MFDLELPVAAAPRAVASPLRLAVRFEPDGFAVDGAKLMGRQAAGNGFLRAAAHAAADGELACVTAGRASAERFAGMVKGFSPAARASWVPTNAMDRLGLLGTLYNPDAAIAVPASMRLRSGVDAWSIVGVTHTTASEQAMALTGALSTAPLMPWDALICTSRSVLGTVTSVIEEAEEHLAWRRGTRKASWMPQLPVIPLGIHTGDFAATESAKAAARAALGIAEDEIVVLFVGRLSFHAKAHPHAMYRAMEAAARRSGKKLVLLQCGWFSNDFIDAAFREGAARYCPSVRALFTDGRDAEARGRSWAAADLFISLSDNIQETFGLVPIEAMAASLPVVVTDWDGYRELVRHGVDGFRIPTSAPEAGTGARLARDFEAGTINYDHYCGKASQLVGVDHGALADALVRLVEDPELRRRMGEAGRGHARSRFDWSVVMASYRALFEELASVRMQARGDRDMRRIVESAPKASPVWPDPFRAFAHYPTRSIGPNMPMVAGATDIDLAPLLEDRLFAFAHGKEEAENTVRLAAAVGANPMTVAEIAASTGVALRDVVLILSRLTKIGSVRPADEIEVPSAER